MGRPQGTPLREDGIYEIRRNIYYFIFYNDPIIQSQGYPTSRTLAQALPKTAFRYIHLVAAG